MVLDVECLLLHLVDLLSHFLVQIIFVLAKLECAVVVVLAIAHEPHDVFHPSPQVHETTEKQREQDHHVEHHLDVFQEMVLDRVLVVHIRGSRK